VTLLAVVEAVAPVAIVTGAWWRACRKLERDADEWREIALGWRKVALDREAELARWRAWSGRAGAESGPDCVVVRDEGKD